MISHCLKLAVLLSLGLTVWGAAEDRVVPLVGEVQQSAITSIADGRVMLANGQHMDLQELRHIKRSAVDAKHGQYAVYLTDGSLLQASTFTLADGQVSVEFCGQSLQFPVKAMAGVDLRQEANFRADRARLFNQAIPQAQTTDVLWVPTDADFQKVPGALIALDKTMVTFAWNDKERRVKISKLFGITFGRVLSNDDQLGRCLLTLTDGSTLWLTVTALADGQLSGQLADGSVATLAWSVVAGIEVRSDRLRFLSDLKPVQVREEALVTASLPWQRDRSAAGEDLVVSGRSSSKGIGVHAKSFLRFACDERYPIFATTVGIHSGTQGRGDCIVRVVVDGQEKAKHRLRGTDPKAHDIRLSVAGAAHIDLIVDAGAGLDIGDHVNWLDARFEKEAAQ